MNPQEQNKQKAPFQNPAASTPGLQKNDTSKQPVAANVQPGAQDKNRKSAEFVKPAADKDADACSATKGSCGTK